MYICTYIYVRMYACIFRVADFVQLSDQIVIDDAQCDDDSIIQNSRHQDAGLTDKVSDVDALRLSAYISMYICMQQIYTHIYVCVHIHLSMSIKPVVPAFF